MSSLPGVVVSGSGLGMAMPRLAEAIQKDPDKFQQIMAKMEAKPAKLGDLGYQVQIFPGWSLCLKFYFSDEDFDPCLHVLWDKNSLQFVRYETLYYIAGCLQKYLQKVM